MITLSKKPFRRKPIMKTDKKIRSGTIKFFAEIIIFRDS